MSNISQLLNQEYQSRKEKNSNFSLRAFARWLGMSPAQLSQLMSGKRPLTAKMAEKITIKLGLSPFERFEMTQSYFLEKSETGTSGEYTSLEEDRFRLIADWYHFAILSLTQVEGAQGDSRWIARQLGISLSDARDACDRLVRMGLLEMQPRFRQIGEPLETTSQIPSEAIQKFHKQILALAVQKLETVDVQKREFQAVTLAINSKKIPLAKKMIDDAMTRICRALRAGSKKDLYTVSIQLFPLNLKPILGDEK